MTPPSTFGTGEAGLQVHHPPVSQSGTTGLRQSPVPQGWAHVCLHFFYNCLRPISIFHEEKIVVSLRGIVFPFVFF